MKKNQAVPRPQPPIITLTTDFGTDDSFAGVTKGVTLGIKPGACIVDITHAVPAQAIDAGAFLLRLAVPYFPRGTIHVAVVDPGVGGDRPAVCVQTDAGIFVGPDNGVLFPAAEQAGIRSVVTCTEEKYWLARHGSTFDGRDVFAPVAAHLSRGVLPRRLGSSGAALRRLALPRPRQEESDAGVRIRGQGIHTDRFGTLLTNITAPGLSAFPTRELSVCIAGAAIAGLASSYGAAGEGNLLALLDSWGVLEIAEQNGSARDRLGVGAGASVVVNASEVVKAREKEQV